MTIWVDGAFVPATRLPTLPASAIAPFETMGAVGGSVPLWRDHLVRLAGAAVRLGLSFVANMELQAAAGELLRMNGDSDGVLRLSLVPIGGPSSGPSSGSTGGRVHVVLQSRARGPLLPLVRLLPTVMERGASPPGDTKAMPRRFYDAVRQQAQDGGADDGIVVANDGRVCETAVGNLWLRLQGTWVTPALDGDVLPGIARARLLAAARRVGLPVAERRCDLGLVHRAEALAHSNAVYGPRPAVLLGQVVPTARFVDTELLPLWRPAAAD